MQRRAAQRHAAIIACAALVACAGPGITLPAVPVDTALSIAAQSPYFPKTDGKTFARAAVAYPATREPKHTVPVGDYLLSSVLRLLPPDRPIERIALNKFIGDCDTRGFIAPTVQCQGQIAIAVSVGGKESLLSATVPDIPVGPLFVAHGDFFGTPSGGHLSISKQAVIVVQRLLAALRPQLERV